MHKIPGMAECHWAFSQEISTTHRQDHIYDINKTTLNLVYVYCASHFTRQTKGLFTEILQQTHYTSGNLISLHNEVGDIH